MRRKKKIAVLLELRCLYWSCRNDTEQYIYFEDEWLQCAQLLLCSFCSKKDPVPLKHSRRNETTNNNDASDVQHIFLEMTLVMSDRRTRSRR